MVLNLIGALLLLIHLVCCGLVCVGIYLDILHAERCMIPVVIFVPVWGILCVLIRHLGVWMEKDGTKEVRREKLQINEQLYRSFFVAPEEDERNVVPLEEALVINDAGLRREMMMNVLNDDPKQYMDFLHQARLNEDPEVVHYAATAMAEISKDYEFRLQMLEETCRKNPDDGKLTAEYCDFLEEYLSQGIMHGQMERVRRNRYCELLQYRLREAPALPLMAQLAESQLMLKNFAQAEKTIFELGRRWPQREEYWLLRVKCAAMQGQGDSVAEILRELRKNQIYLSSKGTLMLKFWEKKNDQEEECDEEATASI